MYPQLLVAALVPASVAAAVGASNNVCNKFPYLALQPLSKSPAVQSFCTSKFPTTPCTTTSTTTSIATAFTTVSTSTTTTGTTTETRTVQTDTSLSTTSTSTVTEFTDTTIETTFTTTSTSTTFTSTATICSNNIKRDTLNAELIDADVLSPRPARSKPAGRYVRVGRREPAKVAASPTPDALKQLAASVVKTFCSCATKPGACVAATTTATSTTTSSVTATVSTQATSISSVTAITTKFVDTTTTITTISTSTTSAISTTVLSTSTVTQTPCQSCVSETQCINGFIMRQICGSRISAITANSRVISVSSVNACREECAFDLNCIYYNVDRRTGECTIYQGAPFPETEVDDSFAWGYYIEGPCSNLDS